MAQFHFNEVSNQSVISNIISNLHFASSPADNLISQTPTTKTTEQLSSEFSPPQNHNAQYDGFFECSNSPSQLIDCRAADTDEEDVLTVSFQSKYIHIFPLYQDYCLQTQKNDLHKHKSFVSEQITPQYVQNLQSSRGAHCHSVATSPPVATPTLPSPHSIRVTPCTLWQDLDEVKVSGLLNSLTPKKIRLQESMFELIGSEASYLRSLGVAVCHFYASKALKQTLSQREHHTLFSNICCVMAASEKFFMDLEMRLGENVVISQVGDIVLQHCPEFQALYVPYVTNMMYQEALIKQLLQHNREFLYSLKKLERDPVCQRQSLKSFLVLPFQRITRIKLLLESILKLTEPNSDSISNLEKAIEAIHEIVSECDKGVQKMKRIEELVNLKMLLDFGKIKSVPLVVSKRFLVHQGPMRQLTMETTSNCKMSFISIYLHLFNDLLIISLKKDQRFKVVDHAEFPTHVHIEHLKTEALGLPPDSFLLRLSQSQTGHRTAMILVTHTGSDKETWIKVLSCKQ